MGRSSLPLSWIMKHKFGFLAHMWRQQEQLLLVKGGYWTLRSLPGWYANIEVVAEADKLGYVGGWPSLSPSTPRVPHPFPRSVRKGGRR